MKSSPKHTNNRPTSKQKSASKIVTKSSQKRTSKDSRIAESKPLRVIGGKHKGLKLYAPASARPSKAILKESCFNILGNFVIDTHFIEAFSGSGSMGIEALSRGAKKAIFFEKDKEALEILQKNLSLLVGHKNIDFSAQNPSTKITKSSKIQTPSNKNYEIISGDSLQNLPPFLATLRESSILYIDPPFFIRQNYADIYEKCANIIAQIYSPALRLIIIEHSSLYKFGECLGRFYQVRQRKFGKSTLTFFAPHFAKSNTQSITKEQQ